MRSQHRERLRALVADARSRVTDRPAWQTVADRSKVLGLSAELSDAAITVGLGTDSVDMASHDHWPADVTAAFKRLGLYDTYSPTTAHGVVTHLTALQRSGLVNSVKGTDFELLATSRLNENGTALGDHAGHVTLATSTTQPGWDATVTSHGRVVDLLQMKETSNQAVIAEHVARYPQYPDVVTTHEAAAAAAAHHVDAGHVIDSGVSDPALTAHVSDAITGTTDAAHMLHEFVPEAAFAVIVTSALWKLRKGESRGAVVAHVREQAAIAGIANLAGLAVQVATGTVLFRPPVSMGTRFVAARGKLAGQVATRMRVHQQGLARLLDRLEGRPEPA